MHKIWFIPLDFKFLMMSSIFEIAPGPKYVVVFKRISETASVLKYSSHINYLRPFIKKF